LQKVWNVPMFILSIIAAAHPVVRPAIMKVRLKSMTLRRP
jgi:hypothetical protein